MDEVLPGESGSAFVVAAGADQLVVKLVPASRNALGNQRRLVRLVSGLRRRGYPAPEYVGAGESGGTIFTVQRRLPGQGLHRPGLPPDPGLFAAVLPDLLAAIELQRDAGDRARPPWPAWLTDTIEAGGDGYCLHATMRRAGDTAALLGPPAGAGPQEPAGRAPQPRHRALRHEPCEHPAGWRAAVRRGRLEHPVRRCRAG
jgi:hypothetical protein